MEKEANFEKFVTKSLLMNRCQFLDNFRLLCLENSDRLNILPVCVNTVITRNVHFLELNIVSSYGLLLTLPTSLFTAKSLQTLILEGDLLVETPSLDVLLPRLEYLSVKDVDYGSDESVRKLIEGCSILKSLCIERNRFDNVVVFNVTSKSLTRLEVKANGFSGYPEGYQRGLEDYYPKLTLEINACDLKYFRLCDCVSEYFNFQVLPNLVELYLFDLDYNLEDSYISMVGEILDTVGKELKILSIGGKEDLISCFIYRANTGLFSLKTLIITTPSYSWCDLIEFLMNMTYNLEVLELKAFCEMFNEIDAPEELFPEYVWLSLRRISISFKIESKDEDNMVRMMEYFLEHAKFLRRIEILGHNYNTSLLTKLVELNRTSSAGKIHVVY